MALAPVPARRPAWLWPVVAACALHLALWWIWAHQGFVGSDVHALNAVAPAKAATPAMVVSWRVAPVQPGAVSANVAQPEAQARPSMVDKHQAPADTATTSASSRNVSPNADLNAPEEAMPAGLQWLQAHYASSEMLERSPQPEMGWFLDEEAFMPLAHGRLLVQVWVSAEGLIDRAALLQAEPPGDWAAQALRPLPGTPMRPGLRAGHAVPSTIVVELMADNERFR